MTSPLRHRLTPAGVLLRRLIGRRLDACRNLLTRPQGTTPPCGAVGMIGWYAHHHGLGHLIRARCVIPHIGDDVTLFSSHPSEDVVVLPIDVEPPRSAACAAAPDPVNLHYAPLGVDGVRHRMAKLTAWADAHDPDLFVVDVSVEVATLMRLLSVPTAVVRQHGRRDDPAHAMCYANASMLLAPYPEWLEEEWVPDWMRQKTVYSGGFSRFDDRLDDLQAEAVPRDIQRSLGVPEAMRVAVVLSGTAGPTGWPVGSVARATPGWRWVVLGGDEPGYEGLGQGWVEEPFDWLRAADVIITHAGHNAVMEAAAARRPTVVVPGDGPYDEQRHKARRLAEAGVAHVEPVWPTADRWPALLEEAQRLEPVSSRLVDGKGARRAGEALTRTARRLRGHVSTA